MSKHTTIQGQAIEALRGHHSPETATTIAQYIGRSVVGSVAKACDALVAQGIFVQGTSASGERTYRMAITSDPAAE